jgi:hypothetical protein
MAVKRKRHDVWSMKKLRFLSLVGITSFTLAHAGLAAGHGGGGGGHGGGGGFHGVGFRGGQFSSMRGGHMFGRGGFHGGDFHGGRFGNRHHRFNNDIIFFNDSGFPGWWGWGYPYGYYGPYRYPYDYYRYGGYGY